MKKIKIKRIKPSKTAPAITAIIITDIKLKAFLCFLGEETGIADNIIQVFTVNPSILFQLNTSSNAKNNTPVSDIFLPVFSLGIVFYFSML